jgi:PhnB protein
MMMRKIELSPYVNFQGRAREAMEFYHNVLGGKLDLQTLNEQGVSRPAGPGDRIRHSRLEADGALIIATDGHPDYPAKVGENMAIALGGTDKDRLTKLFNGLAEGGKIQMPLAKQPWGAEVGWFTDKFGISWTVNVDKA